MLVLVTVGAATAFYMWETGWQDDVEGKTKNADVMASLTIGGSSTVYEFTAVAAEMYNGEFPGYKVSYQKGGSGAGVAAIGEGAVDIGSASRFVKTEEYALYPDLVEHIIAWDGVAVVTSSSNTHGLVSINETVLNDIYCFNGGKTGYSLQVLVDYDSSSDIEWDEVYTTANSVAANCTGSDVVTLYDRDEESGTEETFAKKILDQSKGTLEANDITANHETSNQNLAVAIGDDDHALSFMAFGIANGDSNLDVIPFAEDENDPVTPSTSTIKDQTYPGTRPLVYITDGTPTGDISQYIKYCLQPENNQQITAGSDYVSIY